MAVRPAVNDPFNTAITWLDEPLLGAADGPLAGRTLLVKDLIDTAGIRTTYGSRIYGDHVPTAHATVVQRALDAGAVVVGKANLPEFAWGVLGVNPWYGAVHNPLASREDDRRLVGRERRGARRRARRPRARNGHRLLDPPAVGRLRDGRPQAALGPPADRRRLPARPDARHRRADGPQRRGRRAALVGALGPRRCRSRGSTG